MDIGIEENGTSTFCWLQWNAATKYNVMLPLAAFPMHYYPATDTMKSCRPVQPNLAT